MKKSSILFACMAVLACTSIAFAAAPKGKLVKDANGVALQKHSPAPVGSACTTTTGTKGVIATVTTAGYSILAFDTFTGARKTPIRVKRYLNSNTAYMQTKPGGDQIGLNSDITTVTFKPWSSVPTSYTTCIELTKGGVTP